jgi:hypothetical protein
VNQDALICNKQCLERRVRKRVYRQKRVETKWILIKPIIHSFSELLLVIFNRPNLKKVISRFMSLAALPVNRDLVINSCYFKCQIFYSLFSISCD